MNLQTRFFHKWALLACFAPLAAGPAGGEGPAFGPRQAIRAEWERRAPALTEGGRAALSPAERQRLELSVKRIGAPGAPPLLEEGLEKPTEAGWLAAADKARTPAERYTALVFLNRLKSPRALQALAGLGAGDAARWPAGLHLENALAAALLNGADPAGEPAAFLEALGRAGRLDAVRLRAARLRLRLAGKLPAAGLYGPKGPASLAAALPRRPATLLALVDAWNLGPWERRAELHLALATSPLFRGRGTQLPAWGAFLEALGLGEEEAASFPVRLATEPWFQARILGGLSPKVQAPELEEALARAAERILKPAARSRMLRMEALDRLGAYKDAENLARLRRLCKDPDPLVRAGALQALAAADPRAAEGEAARLLGDPERLVRGSALEVLPAPPEDLEGLAKEVLAADDLDLFRSLAASLERWKLAPERRAALLRPFLDQGDWGRRRAAFQALAALDPATPWPPAPQPGAGDKALLDLAGRLAEAGRPLRVRIRFQGHGSVVLRLDPVQAPMNVANLAQLVRKGYYKGRRVPRVVPDFVVQMGSPSDTMEGGPGYTLRCENSLAWYGPGTVGMALSGPDTGGGQFFITTNATPHLTGRYTRLGEVEDPERALPLLDGLLPGTVILGMEILEQGAR